MSVDLDDQVIGPCRVAKFTWSGSFASAAVHILVVRPNGHLFLQRRQQEPRHLSRLLGIPPARGHVETGEDYPSLRDANWARQLGWHGRELPLRPLLKLTPSRKTATSLSRFSHAWTAHRPI